MSFPPGKTCELFAIAQAPHSPVQGSRSTFRVSSSSQALGLRCTMATNGAHDAFAPSDVLAAVMTMRSGEQDAKKKAHEYLESFQKSVRCGHESGCCDIRVCC